MADKKALRVLFLAAEADPFVKVGGLGDVAGSLPIALKNLASTRPVDVRLVIPYHQPVRQKYPDLPLVASYSITSRSGEMPVEVFYSEFSGVPTYLISGPPITDSPGVYSTNARLDGWKYIFFSLAALELPRQLHWQPHILHANDWHTAIAVYALRQLKVDDPFFAKTSSILSIHNLPFMGAGTEEAFEAFKLTPSQNPGLPWWAQRVPLPLGLEAADRIVAVSPSYSNEILTPEYGCGLEPFLLSRRATVTGIVNGLDEQAWDPATDQAIKTNFTSATLADRKLNKLALSQELEMEFDPALPLLLMIGRMDQQKGVDLALEALRMGRDLAWQAIILGTGDPQLMDAAQKLAVDLPRRVKTVLRFDAAFARRLYAGGDVILMPSRYEPCGLAQMIAMRYGCVPLARATGGLRDTIVDARVEGQGTGFLFETASPVALGAALQRALTLFQDQPAWKSIQLRGMAQNFSWARSAAAYAKLYLSLSK